MSGLARLPREILYFAGIGAYGFGIGIVYWLLTYEPAGGLLLTTFGAGAVGFATLLALSVRGHDATPQAGAEGPFGSPPGRVPGNSLAPLEVGFGLAVVSLSLAFGVWMVIAGIVPIVAGGYAWIRSAERELIGNRLDDGDATADSAEVRPARRAAEPPSE
jgi:uncharacterized protein YjeT (DUF2065 family)